MKKNILLTFAGTLLITACGGSGGDSETNQNQTTPTETEVDNNTPTNAGDGFIVLADNPDTFKNCIDATASESPAYFTCLSGTYKGKNPNGTDCQVEFNGTTFDAKYTMGNDNYSVFSDDKDRTFYAKNSVNGIIVQSAAYYEQEKEEMINNATSTVRLLSELNFTLIHSQYINTPNSIDYKRSVYNADEGSQYKDVNLSCIVTEFKPS